MTQRALELGITAVQRGSLQEGARLIRIAVKGEELTPELRAVAYLWLAETNPDPAHKRACYNEALNVDPQNAEARSRLAALLTAGLPTANPVVGGAVVGGATATGAYPAAAQSFNVADYLAQIVDGPNGAGTAVFVSLEGILATTRRVVGGMERVTVETYAGGQVYGSVIRCFTELDLALIAVQSRPASLLPVTPLPRVPDDAPLTVVSYTGEVTRARQRPTKRAMPPHWIPTSITQLSDAGGDVIFDDKNYLVGIMSRSASLASAAYLYGIHISTLRRLTESTLADLRGERRRYCPDCGNASRAAGAGYFYCEQCGAPSPEARQTRRYFAPQAAAYYEPSGRARCVSCNAAVGIHNNRCLRCGAEQR
ncbi:MAG: serine protease [Anaerolineae bacterium]|nr:serine protease [Anaerolineae bacterium]NUQ06098.1 trypsin-like peptidase domain-containing protein [Anaerolineae bacterium]